MKYINLKLILIATMLLSITSGFAYDIEVDGYYYNLNISESTASLARGDIEYEGTVIIPKSFVYKEREFTVTSISDAFSSNSKIITVNIPNTIQSISSSCFANASKLSKIEGLNNVTKYIGNKAFLGCENLESILLSDSLESIGSYAFSGSGIKEFRLPKNVRTIPKYCFSGCSYLEKIILHENVTAINEYAFKDCISLKSTDIPVSVSSIENGAFMGCRKLQNIKFPPAIQVLSEKVLYNCSIEKFEFPDSLREIKKQALGSNKFIELTIPESVEILYSQGELPLLQKLIFVDSKKSIEVRFNVYQDKNASVGYLSDFLAAPILSFVYIGRNINRNRLGRHWDSSNGYLYDSYTLNLISTPFCGFSSIKEVDLGNNFTSLTPQLFYGCSNLESLNILDGESAISFSSLIYYDALNGSNWWDGYKKVYKNYPLFNTCSIKKMYIGREISYTQNNYEGYKPLYGINLTDISFGDLVKTFNTNLSLNTSSLKNITIGASFTEYPSIFITPNLENIVLAPLSPPACNSFANTTYLNTNLFVHKDSIDIYKNSLPWSNFFNLFSIEDGILNITDENICIKTSEQYQLILSVFPFIANRQIRWSSSDENIAIVSDEGLVTGVSVGSATITASCGAVSAACEVTVTEEDGIEDVLMDSDSEISVYSLQGFLVKDKCTTDVFKELPKGVYIVITSNKSYKIII